jgi:hypothetical protein
VRREELVKLCDGAPGTEVALQLRRRCNGKRARVFPGVLGEIVQWGDGTWDFPTVVIVKVADVRRFLKRTQPTLAEAIRDQLNLTP